MYIYGSGQPIYGSSQPYLRVVTNRYSFRLVCFEVLPRSHRLSSHPRLNAFVI